MAFNKMKEMIEKIPIWVEEGFNSSGDLDLVEAFGKYLADRRQGKRGEYNGRNAISTSQIRIAYGEISRLKMQFDQSSMMMLRPKIAYASTRDGGPIYKDLQEVISTGVNSVSKSSNKKKAFNNFANLFEAFIAYHKAYGGK